MKKFIARAGIIALISSTAAVAEPVAKSDTWAETFLVATATPRLVISNIWGNVRVRPGSAGEIYVTVDEHRSAPTQALFDRSLEILRLDVAADSNGLSIVVGDRNQPWERRDPCPRCRVDYQFDVVVPPGTQIDVKTVTDGRIDVVGITGTISASNVNGPISVSEIRNCEALESVNGAVDLSFSLAPGQDCNIETINGDITLNMPDGTGLDVALDLFNGRMVTEFQVDSYALPAQVEHSSNNGRHRYKIQQSAGLRLEGGGPTFSISSLNGDIRIQKN